VILRKNLSSNLSAPADESQLWERSGSLEHLQCMWGEGWRGNWCTGEAVSIEMEAHPEASVSNLVGHSFQ
jgi:hypothetical protein